MKIYNTPSCPVKKKKQIHNENNLKTHNNNLQPSIYATLRTLVICSP